MQIDFHHAVTYILARWAGFSHEQSDIIAYSSQYVDDSTYFGSVKFSDGQRYTRTASAHKALDLRNSMTEQDIRTWVPFHFLPGNCGIQADVQCNQDYYNRVVCVANSPVAKDMLDECLRQKDKDHGFHRLGITMHVYADTWAHQNFAGVENIVNDASDLDVSRPRDYRDLLDEIATILPTKLGHAQVSCCPDYPYIVWEYRNWKGKIISPINNADRFIEAADSMLLFMRRWLGNTSGGLNVTQETYLRLQLNSFQEKDADERHKQWLEEIRLGNVPGISGTPLDYSKDGQNSWKYLALRTDDEHEIVTNDLPFNPDFMQSNWKRFHDALQFHRLYVLNELLPKYGICAA